MPKFNPYFTKYKPKDTVLIYNAVILEVLEVAKEYPGQSKLKSVFTCESFTGTPKMCVYWGDKVDFEVGDRLNMEGHYKNNVFLVSSVQITKKRGTND